MNTYVILRRSGWRSPEELQQAAARSEEVGNDMPDGYPLDSQLRDAGKLRRFGDSMHLPGQQPGGDLPAW